jgi:hypothetical protein
MGFEQVIAFPVQPGPAREFVRRSVSRIRRDAEDPDASAGMI